MDTTADRYEVRGPLTKDEKAWIRREKKRLSDIKKDQARRYGKWTHDYIDADFALMELEQKRKERE